MYSTWINNLHRHVPTRLKWAYACIILLFVGFVLRFTEYETLQMILFVVAMTIPIMLAASKVSFWLSHRRSTSNGMPIICPHCRRSEEPPTKEDLRRRITYLEKRLNQPDSLTGFIDEWYRQIVRIAHPDRGGDEKVMKLINELKERFDGK
jgi:hypothetical protein